MDKDSVEWNEWTVMNPVRGSLSYYGFSLLHAIFKWKIKRGLGHFLCHMTVPHPQVPAV